MSWSKRQIIEAAFDELGLGVETFDIQPEQMQTGLKKLDLMLAEWNGKGLRLGYPLSSKPTTSSLDDDSGMPDYANNAVILNLAIRMAPSFGKGVSQDTKSDAKKAYRVVLNKAAMPAEMQLPSNTPRGAGNKTIGNPSNNFINPPTDDLAAGEDSNLTF